MATNVSELTREALRLSPARRASLARRLLNSLEPKIDKDVEIAWDKEIRRRVAEIESGSARMVPWEKVYRRLKAKTRAAG